MTKNVTDTMIMTNVIPVVVVCLVTHRSQTGGGFDSLHTLYLGCVENARDDDSTMTMMTMMTTTTTRR